MWILWICRFCGFVRVNLVDLCICAGGFCGFLQVHFCRFVDLCPLPPLLIVSTVPPLGCRHDEWPATGSREEQRVHIKYSLKRFLKILMKKLN